MDIHKKIRLNNPQALFNLIRILQDYLIGKSRLFILILLPFDITISFALIIYFLERFISYKIVNKLFLYILHDLAYVKEIFLMIVKNDYVSQELTQQINEKDMGGNIYKRLQRILKFCWSVFVLLLTFPVLPIFWAYDYIAPRAMIGFLYYIVIFIEIHIALKIFLFVTATFLVASTTVPVLFSAFVYVKFLFSLEKKTFKEIRTEADTLFLRLYAFNFSRDELESDLTEEEKVEGGIYYLFLKGIHSMKDIFFSLCLQIIKPKNEQKSKLTEIKDKIVTTFENKRKVKMRRLIGPLLAFLITFVVASFLAFAGTQGKGLLGSLVLSVVDAKEAAVIWSNFSGSGLGYFQELTFNLRFFPNFLKPVIWAIDNFFYYLFTLWHTFYPIYLSGIELYYTFWMNVFGLAFFR